MKRTLGICGETAPQEVVTSGGAILSAQRTVRMKQRLIQPQSRALAPLDSSPENRGAPVQVRVSPLPEIPALDPMARRASGATRVASSSMPRSSVSWAMPALVI